MLQQQDGTTHAGGWGKLLLIALRCMHVGRCGDLTFKAVVRVCFSGRSLGPGVLSSLLQAI